MSIFISYTQTQTKNALHTYIHIHIHTYIHTYTHTHIHTYTHTHIHTNSTQWEWSEVTALQKIVQTMDTTETTVLGFPEDFLELLVANYIDMYDLWFRSFNFRLLFIFRFLFSVFLFAFWRICIGFHVDFHRLHVHVVGHCVCCVSSDWGFGLKLEMIVLLKQKCALPQSYLHVFCLSLDLLVLRVVLARSFIVYLVIEIFIWINYQSDTKLMLNESTKDIYHYMKNQCFTIQNKPMSTQIYDYFTFPTTVFLPLLPELFLTPIWVQYFKWFTIPLGFG